MTKFKKPLLIFSILALIIGVALATFIVLSLTDSLKDELIAIEFTVDDADKVYDGEPLKASTCRLTSGDLIEGHTPIISFTGEQTDVGIGFSGLDIKIVNKAGIDVSKEYDIKVNGGFLNVSTCSLRVSLTARDVMYNGATVDIGDGYTVTSGVLAPGHRVLLQIKDEWFENAGTVVAGNTLSRENLNLMIVDVNGRNVTGNYDVSLLGKINIIQRDLAISVLSAEKTYDGKPLIASQHKIESGSLVNGHRLEIEFKDEYGGTAQVTNANEEAPLKILANVKVYDSVNTDVTENYNIKSSLGELTVYKANLTVTAKSDRWVYNGKAHFINDNRPASAIGLVGDDKITVQYSGSITDVSVGVNTIKNYSISDSHGVDKSGNYKITIVDGTLEVIQATLKVMWKTYQKQYGDLYDGDFTELYSTDSNSDITNLSLQFESEKLKSLLDSFTAIGNSTYIFNDFKVYNDGSDDITEMFDINVIPGNLMVARRDVTLSVGKLSKTYDGNFIFTENLPASSALVNNHKLASINCKEPDLDIYSHEYIAGNSYSTDIVSISVVDEQGNNVNGYYNLHYDTDVQISFSARNLTIISQPGQKVYDGTPLYGGALTAYALLSGDMLRYTPKAITDVTDEEVENKPETVKIINGSNDDVTDLYNISWSCGKLKVNRRDLSISIETYFCEDINSIYYMEDPSILVKISNLADGEEIRYLDEKDQVIENFLDCYYFDKTGSGLYENVKVTVWRGEVNVSDNYKIPKSEEITGIVVITG